MAFTDGYSYLGSSFSVSDICKEQTQENQISLRIVSNDGDREALLSESKDPCIVYDFYKANPFVINQRSTKIVSLLINEVSEIEEII